VSSDEDADVFGPANYPLAGMAATGAGYMDTSSVARRSGCVRFLLRFLQPRQRSGCSCMRWNFLWTRNMAEQH